MARKPRIHVAGALYHVIMRGNHGQLIFRDDKDRYRLQDLIEEGARRFRYRVLGYCWMGNHIHAAMQVDKVSLSTAMHNLSFRYTSYFNWRHACVGHLFQGRYKAILVDSDSYLLQLVRYIHMNPVRAQLVDELDAWTWSSHRAYLGASSTPEWLATETVLARFSTRAPRARAAYARFMGMQELMMTPVDFKRGNQKAPLLGDELFALRMERKASHAELRPQAFATEQIVSAVCLAAGISEDALCKKRQSDVLHARMAAACLVNTGGDRNLAALARMLMCDPSTMSRAASRYETCAAAMEIAARALCILTNASMHA